MKHPTFNIEHRKFNGRARHSVRAVLSESGGGAHGVTRPTQILERWKLSVQYWMFSALLILVAGCATYHPQPISPQKTAAAFDARSLQDEGLHAFLETNHITGAWPRTSWDLNALTLVAFYDQPSLAEAREQFAAMQAAEITAGERPNPTVGFTPTYDTTTTPPWILGLTWDIPLETAGKRGKRIAEAQHLSEAARWNLVSAVWQVRSQVRTALLNLYVARETESLLNRQESAQSNVVRLLAGQFAAGGGVRVMKSPRPASRWRPRNWRWRTPSASAGRRACNWPTPWVCRSTRSTARNFRSPA